MTTIYALRHETPEGILKNGRWSLYRHSGDVTGPGEKLGGLLAIGPEHVQDAHQWATRTLRTFDVRVLRWSAIDDDALHVAVTAPAHGQWTVVSYRGRGDRLWRINADGSWSNGGDTRYETFDRLERAQGPLIPTEVSSLGALVDELAIFRAMTVYQTGPEMCVNEFECEEYVDEDGNEIEGMTRCSHVVDVIATAREAMQLATVTRSLVSLEKALGTAAEAATPTLSAEYIKGLACAVEALRAAIDSVDE